MNILASITLQLFTGIYNIVLSLFVSLIFIIIMFPFIVSITGTVIDKQYEKYPERFTNIKVDKITLKLTAAGIWFMLFIVMFLGL